MAEALDKFGAFIVAKLRDAAIDYADALLAAHWKAPGLQALQADLQRLSADQRAIVRRCVIQAVDSGLHDFLFALQEEHDAGGEIAVVVDGRLSRHRAMDFTESRISAGTHGSASMVRTRTRPNEAFQRTRSAGR